MKEITKKKIGSWIATIMAMLMILFSSGSLLYAEQPGCKYVSGKKYGIFGCWGGQEWCIIDCQ